MTDFEGDDESVASYLVIRGAVANTWTNMDVQPSDVHILSVLPSTEAAMLRAQKESGVILSYTITLPKPVAPSSIGDITAIYEMEINNAIKTGVFERALHQAAKDYNSGALSAALVVTEPAVVMLIQ